MRLMVYGKLTLLMDCDIPGVYYSARVNIVPIKSSTQY